MKRFAAWALAACAAATALANEPASVPVLTASQVVEKNAAARGGAQEWRKIDTMAWTGRVESASRSGRKVPFVLEQKRPDRTRFEVTVDGQKSVRVFDGTDGWKVRAGSTGRPEVQPYTADELKFARGAPVIEGPLMDYAARGAAITLAGVQEIEGRMAYALGLRLASGTSYRVWIDAETFLELRYDREFMNAQGRPAVTSVFFADYRSIEGLRMPLTIETGTPDGKTRDKLVIEQVALNPHLDDRTFAKPGSAVARRRGVTVDTRSAAQGGTPARAAP
jgi:outer membrane lipoprotein-sorting protein